MTVVVQMQTPAFTLLHHIHFLAPLVESPQHSSGADSDVSLSQRLWDVGITGATPPCIQATADSGTSERCFGAGRSSTLQAAGLR